MFYHTQNDNSTLLAQKAEYDFISLFTGHVITYPCWDLS